MEKHFIKRVELKIKIISCGELFTQVLVIITPFTLFSHHFKDVYYKLTVKWNLFFFLAYVHIMISIHEPTVTSSSSWRLSISIARFGVSINNCK